ncbi:MAG TPA: helix-turn-helix domain-containing protein [Sporichthya sp.]|nr:helix-turn-helix domain-containing protein [Sporichthya sp.]
MIDVLEAARRTGKDPETIRRWIRSGKLRAQKVGLKHMIDESDLPLEERSHLASLPPQLRTMMNGEPMPDVAAWVRASRDDH